MSQAVDIGILILAAGFGRRFGADKRLAPLPDGTPLLLASTANALASGLPVTVCLRAGDDAIAAQVERLGADSLLCPQAHLGMAHTLAAGTGRLQGRKGVLVALGDMPEIEPATFCRVAEALVAGGICQPVYSGKPGHPVGFSRYFFPALAALSGDCGARVVITENREAVTRLPVEDAGILKDIDRPQDIPPG